jgi:DNA primase
MFPIHSFTGRVIAFGGRTLKSDKSVPKYVNSPESEIYHKSNVLYGLYFAKKAIRDEDNCFLVEGYADVLSVHQAGIENVVASSGTSLTVEQIRLISRFTKNITILYDGDAAGIKASLRGLDMILEEGLNVKVVLFPDGHDPDSYVRNFGTAGFKKHIADNKKDFILYKTDILLKEAANDPIKKAEVIREIVESIAKIPDSIKASVFIKECSHLLKIDERALLSELNKMRLAKAKKDSQQQISRPVEVDETLLDEPIEKKRQDEASQEKEIIRLLLLYGNEMVNFENETSVYVGSFIIASLEDVAFKHPICKKFIEIYTEELNKGQIVAEELFIHSTDNSIVDLAISKISFPYYLSPLWVETHHISTPDETKDLKSTVLGAIYHLKKVKIEEMIDDLTKELLTEADVNMQILIMEKQMRMKKVHKAITDYLGTVIPK